MRFYRVSIGNDFLEEEVIAYQRRHCLETPDEAAEALWLEWSDNWDTCLVQVEQLEDVEPEIGATDG